MSEQSAKYGASTMALEIEFFKGTVVVKQEGRTIAAGSPKQVADMLKEAFAAAIKVQTAVVEAGD